MADTKLNDLPSGTAAGTDIIYAVKDPAGTPVDRKIALSSVKDYILGLANTWTAAQTFNNGTITTSSPVIDAAQTWNASGTTFTGLRFNVTNTASNDNSLLMDLQIGGSSIFALRRDGFLQLNGAGASLAASSCGVGTLGAGIFHNGSNSGGYYLGSSADVLLTRRAAANLRLGAADAAAPVAQTLSVQSVVAGTIDTAGANLTITGSQGTGTGAGGSIIFQVAPAGTTGTAQNSLVTFLEATSARAFNLYNTTDVTTNFERGFARWSSNVFQIGTAKGGTGTARALELQTDGTSRWSIGATTGHLLAATDNTFDIGASGATRPRNVFAAGYVAVPEVRGAASRNSAFVIGANWVDFVNAASQFNFRITPSSSTKGVVQFSDNSGDFNLLQFGGTTSSSPALKRSSASLQVRLADDSGFATIDGQHQLEGTAPAANNSTGAAGDIRYDADYIYICTAANTWKRVAIATWP